MEMVKKIFLFLSFFAAFLIVSLNVFEISASNDIPIVNNESFNVNNPVVKYSLSTDSVKLNEKFKVKIDYDKNNQLVNTENKISGFNLSNEINNKKQNSLEFELIYENPEEKIEFTSYLSFKDGSSYKVSIYGFLYNGTMFLSEVSRDKAILKCA